MRTGLGLVVFALGCGPERAGTSDTVASDGFLDGLGCPVGADAYSDVQAALTDVGTVIQVSWSADAGDAAYVAFGVDADHIQVTNTVTGSSTVLLRGVPVHTDVHFRVIGGDGSSCSSEHVLETGGLASELPALDFAGTPGDDSEFVVSPIITASGSFASIVSAQGELVWALPMPTTTWRARLAQDGSALRVNHPADTISSYGGIYKVGFDGSQEPLWEAIGLHTDFTELPDGTLAGLVWDVRDIPYNGMTVRVAGDDLVEHSPDGVDTTVWTSFDHFSPDLSQPWGRGFEGQDSDVVDWSHANGVSYDAETDAYYLSLDGLETVVAVSRASATQLWSVSLSGADYTTAQGDLVRNPHSFYRVTDNRYAVFDRNNPGSAECSSATVFSLDDTRMEALQEMRYVSPDCLNVYYLGEAQPIAGGGMLIVWATSGRLERLDDQYRSVWTISSELGAGIGFSDDVRSLYPGE